jgi:hypothetical protein
VIYWCDSLFSSDELSFRPSTCRSNARLMILPGYGYRSSSFYRRYISFDNVIFSLYFALFIYEFSSISSFLSSQPKQPLYLVYIGTCAVLQRVYKVYRKIKRARSAINFGVIVNYHFQFIAYYRTLIFAVYIRRARENIRYSAALSSLHTRAREERRKESERERKKRFSNAILFSGIVECCQETFLFVEYSIGKIYNISKRTGEEEESIDIVSFSSFCYMLSVMSLFLPRSLY